MISKKTIPVAVLLLLGAALVVAGASQTTGVKVPPGNVVLAPGASTDQGSLPVVPSAPALSPASGSVAFSDGFDTSALSSWRTLPSADGRWAAQDGRLQQWGAPDSEPSEDPAVLVTNDTSFSDVVIDAMVYQNKGDDTGLVFRGSDSGYYRLTLAKNVQNAAPKARLDRVASDGTATQVAVNNTWAGYGLGKWQHVQVSLSGSHIRASVDGTTLIDANDSTYTSGWIGVWSIASRGANFDNIRVQRNAAGR